MIRICILLFSVLFSNMCCVCTYIMYIYIYKSIIPCRHIVRTAEKQTVHSACIGFRDFDSAYPLPPQRQTTPTTPRTFSSNKFRTIMCQCLLLFSALPLSFYPSPFSFPPFPRLLVANNLLTYLFFFFVFFSTATSRRRIDVDVL